MSQDHALLTTQFPDDLRAYLDRATRAVNSWPAWKQAIAMNSEGWKLY